MTEVQPKKQANKPIEGLYARKVSKRFLLPGLKNVEGTGRNVLSEIDFSLHPSEIIGLVGRTGVGKTTLGKIMGGIFKADSGAVLLDKRDLSKLSASDAREVRRLIRYVPQNPDAVLSETVRVEVAMGEAQSVSPLTGRELSEWSERVLSLPLFKKNWLHRQFGELSLGERRRVVNLRSLQSCPRYLIMDEPFNGLDLNTRGAMLKLLRVTAKEKRTGILIISHDVSALREVAHDIKLLSDRGIRAYQPEKKKK